MKKRWNKTATGAVIGLFLVGCSLLSARHSPGDQASFTTRPPAGGSLSPGLSPVTVGPIGETEATVSWASPWEGPSRVLYGASPRLMPHQSARSPLTTAQRLSLRKLKPGTRYYFQVETETPLGVARSAVLSFRTR